MSANSIDDNDDEEKIVETTLFEDLERIQREHEVEDEKTLAESESVEEEYIREPSEEEKENATQKLFLDDGKLDYDPKFPINFNIGEIAEHFNLTSDELNRFSEIYEKIHRIMFSQSVYNKSLQDQIKQKGNKMDIGRAVSTWSNMLDKLCDLKMLGFLCDLVELGDLKTKVMDREIEKLFGKPVINLNNKANPIENTISDQLTSITRKLNKAGI